MRLLRTFLVLLSALSLSAGLSACGGEGSGEPDASTTTGVGPQEVEDPGEGGAPGDGNPPTPPGGEVDY